MNNTAQNNGVSKNVGGRETDSPAQLRIGLLGAGVISAPHALALQTVPSSKIVAVCDRDSAKANALAQTWKVPSVFDSLTDMLAKSDLDVVHVLLPPSAHAAAAIQCLEAGAHVFVEKPFCSTSQDCSAVQRAAADAGRLAGVNHNITFMPGVLRLFEAIRQLRLGRVEHVTIAYNMLMPALSAGQHGHWMFGSPERIVLELAPHPLSVVVRLVGAVKACAALASGQWNLNNGQKFYDTWQASMECERGSAQMLLSVGREYSNTWVHVIGQDGEAYVDLRRNTLRISEKTRYMRSDNLVDAWRNSRGLMADALRNFRAYALGATGLGPAYELQEISVGNSIRRFYQAVRESGDFPANAAEGTDVVAACESIIESSNQRIAAGGVYADANR